MSDVVLRMHYHDNDGLPDQLEVVEAPAEAVMSLDLVRMQGQRMSTWWGDTFVFGTPGLGCGRVAYQVTAWDPQRRALLLVRRYGPLPCCDMHNVHCEPPGDLCCYGCTEIGHPEHSDGGKCVLNPAGGTDGH
jgi:hypothetical protein